MASELDDLKTAVASTVALVTEATTDIDGAISKLAAMVTTGVDPAQVEAQAQAIATANSSMKTELMKLEATLNPPAAPPTTPPPANPPPAA